MYRSNSVYQLLSWWFGQRRCFGFHELRDALRGQGFDWEALIRTAGEENVLPALFGRSQELGLELPSDVSEFLRTVRSLNFDRNRLFLAEFISITKALNSMGVEPVALKGIAYLLTGIYRDPAGRYLLDIDLLVPESQLSMAVAALKHLDYVDGESAGHPLWHHHYPLLLGSAKVGIELHHSLGLGICRSLLPGREIIECSSGLELDGARFRLPSPECLLMHHVTHSQIQNRYFKSVWPDLRDLYDFALLVRHFNGMLNWNAIQTRFRRHKREGTLAIYCLLAERVLKMDQPFPLRMSVTDRLRWLHRRTLRVLPALRHVDPFYRLSSAITHRAHLIPDFRNASGGWKPMLAVPFRGRFYSSFLKYGLRHAACESLGWPSAIRLSSPTFPADASPIASGVACGVVKR